MDKSVRKFICFSLLLVFVFVCAIAAFSYIYTYSTITTYNYLLLIIIQLTIIITLVSILAVIAVLQVYRTKRAGSIFNWLTKLALKALFPVVKLIAGIFKSDKDTIRKVYVEINNILVESEKKRYKPQDILVLLPHCLQSSECEYKITNNMFNCRECGKCCIGEVVKLVGRLGVKARVVTGGTAARNIVRETKPKIIVSVACERDLASGIADVGNTPVVGIFNQRPNGPCRNTILDTDVLEQKLKGIII